jgi:hypothetical protein
MIALQEQQQSKWAQIRLVLAVNAQLVSSDDGTVKPEGEGRVVTIDEEQATAAAGPCSLGLLLHLGFSTLLPARRPPNSAKELRVIMGVKAVQQASTSPMPPNKNARIVPPAKSTLHHHNHSALPVIQGGMCVARRMHVKYAP